MNKRGTFVGLFVFIILSITIVFVSAIFIYIGDATETQLKQSIGDRDFGGANTTNETIDMTIGKVNDSYQALYWVAIFLIFAMIIGIIVGAFLVTTHPLFIISHIFGTIVAVILGAGVSNAYEIIINKPTLAGIFDGFVGANEILLNLPVTLTVLGFAGAIIMFTRMGKRKEIAFG